MLRALRRRRERSRALWARLAEGAPVFLVAGTNVVEAGGEAALAVAREVARVSREQDVPAVFKASWDKANRSAAGAYRGVGLDEGLRVLERVREETGLPVLTDVHETGQVQAVAEVVDVVQVPSFLCRQTDLVERVAASGRVVNLKRGQFASAAVMGQAVLKARLAGAEHVMVCERGMTFGMDDLVFDPRQLVLLREACPGAAVVVDATHACQRPPQMTTSAATGAAATASSGSRAMVPVVARAAAATGVLDGLFVELHPDPSAAPVDGALQLDLKELGPLVAQVLNVARASSSGGK